MNFSHQFVKSNIYELIRTIEFDIAMGIDGFYVRVELFCSLAHPNKYRAHIWRSEFYRIQSTFPQDSQTHQPLDLPSDELIFIDFSTQLSGDYSDFHAENETVAIQLILDDCQQFLKRVMGE